MTTERVKRKISAIFSADVEGYSRLMGDDEVATVRTLENYRNVMVDLIEQHRGRVVDSPGDNLLAEFGSVVDAVQCAVGIQQVLKAKNAELPENRRMQFRIGVNLGDVIEEGERIYGDGVNIAARIEGLAQGGGICVSGSAYEQIENKLALGYEYLGEHAVKNITKPVRVYRVPLEPQVSTKKRAGIRRWKKVAVAAAAVVILGAGAFAIWNYYFRPPPMEPASEERMAFSLPDKPSIAVLPFTNMSEDPKQEFFSDGMTEEIITALSKVPYLLVIARNSTFSYKGKPVKICQVAEDLGVRYVLEGSFRKAGDKVRVTAQLIDAIKGHHLWAERYERELKDIFALQDEITRKILWALEVKLTEGEQATTRRKVTDNLEAYLKALQAIEYLNRLNKEGNLLARQMAEEAMALDPEYARPYRVLAITHVNDIIFGTSKSPKRSMERADELAQKAISLDDSDPCSYETLSFIYLIKRQHDRAIAEAERAIALDSNGADAHYRLGNALISAGRPEEAIASLEKAIRINPIAPASYFLSLGRAYRDTGRYEEAIGEYRKVINRTPDSPFAHIGLAATYSLAGRDEEARAEVAEVLRIVPTANLEHLAKRRPYKNQADTDRFIDAMRKAGLPEKPPLPLPDKPSIAVLPFANMSDDPKQEYFSDGITEEIITALSKTPKLFVIARNSTFTYKNKPTKVQKVGRELGVRYVLEGSVRKAGDKVRVTAQLVDAKTGNHLWAERYDRDLKNVFAIQDEITKKIITALHVKLTEGEQAGIYAKGTDNLEAYLKTMKAHWLVLQSTKDGVLKTRQLAEEAIALDPDYAFAYKTLGTAHGLTVQLGMSKNPRESIKRAIELFRKAIELDDSLAIAHISLGFWSMYARQYDTAIAEGRRAFELEPNSADVIMGYAGILTFLGEPEEAIPLYKEALRLNPKPPSVYLRFFCIALRDSGQYEKAIAQGKKAVEQEPNDLIAWAALASSLSLAGHEEEARAAAKEILRLNPKFSVARYQKVSPQKDRAAAKRYCDALRKAGLPE